MKKLAKIIAESLMLLSGAIQLNAAYIPNTIYIKYNEEDIIKYEKNNNLSPYNEDQYIICECNEKIVYSGYGGIQKSPVIYNSKLKKKINECLCKEKTEVIEKEMSPLEKNIAEHISKEIISDKYKIDTKVKSAKLSEDIKSGNIYINIDETGIKNIFYTPKN
jgi:hypothetical protein